jgi:hypothetical protein
MKRSMLPELSQRELDALKVWRQQRDADLQKQAAADTAFTAKMRGRHIHVGGHDGKVMYATISRPCGSHMWRIPLRTSPRTERFMRVAQSLGADPNNIIGWWI